MLSATLSHKTIGVVIEYLSFINQKALWYHLVSLRLLHFMIQIFFSVMQESIKIKQICCPVTILFPENIVCFCKNWIPVDA